MTHPFQLTGKTILVTGATSGLGMQAAVSISEMGGTVVITGRRKEKLEETLSLLVGSGHRACAADLTVAQERDELVAQLPALDGIAHCAGITLLHPFKFSDEEKFHKVYATNVEAPFYLTQKVLKAKKLLPEASLVFISSLAPFTGTKGHAIYAGTKASIISLARVLAHELASTRIRANSIAPAMVKTSVVEGFIAQVSPEVAARDEARYPLGYGNPRDVANAIVFFLSRGSKWITGSNLIMDAGLT
jgi:NAD(P)-dependent dehydrogenase (short-subunit alcohol dehydrogenase family)